MRTRSRRSPSLLAAGALTIGAFAVGGATVAAQNPPAGDTAAAATPPAVAATSTVTLPLLGAPLVVDVSTDVGGGIAEVSLNQADDYTADRIKPNRVAFVNDAGTTKVRVAGHWGGQNVSASASTLAEISGPGGWTGDVFGDGQTTTVNFTVGATAEGAPDVSGVTVASAATYEIDATEYGDRTWGDASVQSASARITFEQNGQRRSLEITAVVATKPDGSKANVIVGVSGVRGRELVEGEQVGTHTWSGTLCDGTAASLTYTVDATGAITEAVPTPAGEVFKRDDRAWVAFSRHEGVAITTSDRGWRGDDTDGELVVGVSEWFRCERVDPVVNTDIDPDADRGHDGGTHRWDHKDGDWSDWDRSDRADADHRKDDGHDDQREGDQRDGDQRDGDHGDWDGDHGDWGGDWGGERDGDRDGGWNGDDDGHRGDDDGRDGWGG